MYGQRGRIVFNGCEIRKKDKQYWRSEWIRRESNWKRDNVKSLWNSFEIKNLFNVFELFR